MEYGRRLRTILDELEAAFTGIAEFNTKNVFSADGYSFGEAYLKVGYRLGTALLTSREVALVVADFPEAQVRTVTTAQSRVRSKRDRLEQGILILAHRDPNGSMKLRQWGRDQGTTILPLDYSGGVPRGEDLLRVLLEDLYSFDRFDLAGPVWSEYQFFGRTFAPDLARRLTHGAIQAMFGMRKIGKTSLLNMINSELKRQHCRRIMIDASDDQISSLDAATLMRSIGDALELANESSEGYRNLSPADESALTAAGEASRVLDLIRADHRPLVLFIDEVDYITPSSPEAPHWKEDFNIFFRALRRIYQEATRDGPVFSIVLTGVSSRWFTEGTVNGIENAALALVPEGYLSPLERSESIEMVRTLGQACGLVLDDKSCDAMAYTASDNPFWLRKLGSFVNSCYRGQRPATADPADVDNLCQEFIEVEGAKLALDSLSHLFRIYPNLGLAAVEATKQNKTDLDQQLISYLGRYGILSNGTNPSGPMVASGLDRWYVADYPAVRESVNLEEMPQQATSEPPALSQSSDAMPLAVELQWDEMLGEVSRLRNLEEVRLRELILVVVRSEGRDSGRKPAEVILASLPVDRRESLKSQSANQIMKTLYWQDLLNIVRRHWAWFQQIFGDKLLMEQWGSIVNDRPDAHAKDFDLADLALQRKAIGWFKQSIDRSELL